MTLSESDARHLIHLLGETAMMSREFSRQKRHLMNGLCELIHADSWVWALGCQMKAQKAQVFVSFVHGGFSEQGFSDYLEAVEHPDMIPVASRFAESIEVSDSQTTMRRDEIDTLGISYDGILGELWEQANIGPLMLSGRPIDKNSVSTVGIYRRLGSPPFTDREKFITNLVLSEVSWLHFSGWPEDKGATTPKLFPRQRVVLNLLCEGLGRKQIAAALSLSENTVSGYAKDIYRHFSVNSHAELMRKFSLGVITAPQFGE